VPRRLEFRRNSHQIKDLWKSGVQVGRENVIGPARDGRRRVDPGEGWSGKTVRSLGTQYRRCVDNYGAPQTSQCREMAGRSSALDVSFHADFGVMAQCRRRLFLDYHTPVMGKMTCTVGVTKNRD
jgi:hypothetical protein